MTAPADPRVAIQQRLRVLADNLVHDQNGWHPTAELCIEAADQIAALEAERAQQQKRAETALAALDEMQAVAFTRATERDAAAEAEIAQLRSALRELDTLCDEVRLSHRDKESADYNACEDGECAWCADTKKAAALLLAPSEATK